MLRKILVVNKFHFISGGAERYFFSVMEALRRRSIEPIPFSVDYAKTLPSPYRNYFIPPVVKGDEAKIQNQDPGFREKIALAARAIYSREAHDAVKRIGRDHRPDLAYFLNFNNHISPSAIEACAHLGIPVVMRLSDFNLRCVSNMYFRDNRLCTDCKQGLRHAVIHRCVHGSLSKSMISAFATWFHRKAGFYRAVSAFVTPSDLMRRELIELGYDPSRIHQIPTFAEPHAEGEPDRENPYILFVGRFAPYKGPDTALRAFALIQDRHPRVRLELMGDEQDADAHRLRRIAEQTGCRQVRFLAFERDKKKLYQKIGRALFTLVPSENYENLPNTILESYACGSPVIATRLGSLPEVVREGITGLLFNFRDLEDFSGKMDFFLRNEEARARMGRNAYRILREDYSEQRHMTRLLGLFEEVLACQKKPDKNTGTLPKAELSFTR